MTAAFHGGVLQQSRLQDRVWWPPIQCEVSKPRPTKVLVVRFSEPRKYTDGCRRGRAHLEFVLLAWWLVFMVIETYPKKNCGLLIRPVVHRRMWELERLHWEERGFFWIADTWHIIEQSWWLARKVSRILAGHTARAKGTHCREWYLWRNMSPLVSGKTRYLKNIVTEESRGTEYFGQTYSCFRRYIKFLVRESHSPLSRSVISRTGMAWKRWYRIFTTSVIEISGTLAACCLSGEMKTE